MKFLIPLIKIHGGKIFGTLPFYVGCTLCLYYIDCIHSSSVIDALVGIQLLILRGNDE